MEFEENLGKHEYSNPDKYLSSKLKKTSKHKPDWYHKEFPMDFVSTPKLIKEVEILINYYFPTIKIPWKKDVEV